MPPSSPPHAQRGLATLTVSLILLVLMSLVTFFASRSILFEIKTSNNQYRSIQAKEAAEAGLERGMAWLLARMAEDASATCSAGGAVRLERATLATCPTSGTRPPPTAYCPDRDGNGIADPDLCACLDVAAATCNHGIADLQGMTFPASATAGQDQYAVTTFFRVPATGLGHVNQIEVVAMASTLGAAANDSFLSRATVSEQIRLSPRTATDAPPNPGAQLLVKNQVQDVTGTPDICPRNAAPPGNPSQPCGNVPAGDTSVAIATLDGSVGASGHFNTHGGTAVEMDVLDTLPGDAAVASGEATPPVHSVLFAGMTESQIRELSEWQFANLPLAKRTVFYYGRVNENDSGSAYTSYGAPPNKFSPSDFGLPPDPKDKPIVLYVSRSAYTGDSCPGFQSGTYYGVFYFGRSCSGHGWGNVKLYGSLAVEGSITKFSANTALYHWDTRELLGQDDALSPGEAARVPGTWQDIAN